MLLRTHSRRRSRYSAYICALLSALLLLLSVSLLYTRLSLSHHDYSFKPLRDFDSDPLLSDSNNNEDVSADDKIDELDIVEENSLAQNQNQDEVIDFLRTSELADYENDGDDQSFDGNDKRDSLSISIANGYFFDRVNGVIRRRVLNKKSIEDWHDDDDDAAHGSASIFGVMGLSAEDKSKAAFGSDDVIVDDGVRKKIMEVKDIEDALLLKLGRKVSPLRQGWGDWFDKKSDFLRKDKMFKSNFEILNPLNNPLLQDPDGVGLTGFTRGDRAVQRWFLSEFKKVPFPSENYGFKGEIHNTVKRAERRTLNENEVNGNKGDVGSADNVDERNEAVSSNSEVDGSFSLSTGQKDDGTQMIQRKDVEISGDVESLRQRDDINSKTQTKSEFFTHVYADGKRWGYYPGLHPYLPFTEFMESFFRVGKCRIKVFLVWNSPPWMYSVRHQRGLESLFYHHPDACVVLFSETVELDFYKDNFVDKGYKIAVAMPNLDELLQGTPTLEFASVWFEWRKTKFYPVHYSELIRLAALYKYGGLYLDTDVVVLQPLSLLNDSISMEHQLAKSSLNGAVMAFRRHSPFIKECLNEFYLTYDETILRWNGADLLTRVADKFLSPNNAPTGQLQLKVLPSRTFFPISSQDIVRYFTGPATGNEKAQQDDLFKRTLNESLTFHFWNSLTSNLIPEPGSLVARLINHYCIRCTDLL